MRFLSFSLAVVLSCAVAYAETPKELYERATAAFALQNYEEAAALYEKAFGLRPDPALLYNAAQAHRMGGNKVRALKLYQSYLKLYPDHVANRVEVEKHIVHLKAAIASDEASASAPPTVPRPVSPDPRSLEPTTPEPAPAPPIAVAPVTVAAAPAPADKPVWKKPWFWGVVAGAVVVVGVGVGLGVGLGTASSPHDPSPTVGTLQAN
jgi:tetratricopeptide (TPR) repeat protein